MFEAFGRIARGDPELVFIVLTSLKFSFFSTLFSVLPGIPLGASLAFARFPGRRVLAGVFGALAALPTVVIGLFVYSLISRSGPFGFLGWLYSGPGVVLGQAALALPIVVGSVYVGLSKIDPRFQETLTTLGAKRFRRLVATAFEARYVLASSVLSAFGRVTGEVGVSMMLGGNIRGSTRTMTTAVALEASRGEFALALSLGFVLLVIALFLNVLVNIGLKHER